MKHASCVLIPDDGRVLAISRRNNYTQWGLPGGKVDPGESSLDAAQRELNEEIGLHGVQNLFIPLLSDVCPGDNTFWVTTYLWTGRKVTLDMLQVQPGFAIGWKSFDQLSDPFTSPFATYNQKAVRAYALYLGDK